MIYEYQKDEREITLRFNLFSDSYFFSKRKQLVYFIPSMQSVVHPVRIDR